MKIALIKGKEWFDKVNGNSYFSARVYVYDKMRLSRDMEMEKTIVLPFQYGYGQMYKQQSRVELEKLYGNDEYMIFDSYIDTGCNKKEVVSWGQE